MGNDIVCYIERLDPNTVDPNTVTPTLCDPSTLTPTLIDRMKGSSQKCDVDGMLAELGLGIGL